MTLKQVTEALVFASPKPISTKEIIAALRGAGTESADQETKDIAAAKEDDVLAALAEVQAELTATGRAFQLVERVNGWTLVSEPTYATWVRQLYPEAKPTRLTGPQLETLAIIAYRQPVTRADCEAVRGVAVDGVVQVLLDRGLVKIAGRAEVPGRPLLYSTTEYFLQHFGLKTTDELPNATELKRVVLPTAPKPAEEQKPEPEAAATPEAEVTAEEPAAAVEVSPATPADAPTETPETEPESPAGEPATESTHEPAPAAES